MHSIICLALARRHSACHTRTRPRRLRSALPRLFGDDAAVGPRLLRRRQSPRGRPTIRERQFQSPPDSPG